MTEFVPVMLLHVCIYWFTFWHRLQPACKGLQETPLPLHKTTEVSCHFSTFVTEFMFLKRLEKRVRCKEHHLALRAETQSIVFATSPLLHTGRVLGAARLCSWAQGGCKGRALSLADKDTWAPGTWMLWEKLLLAPVPFTLLSQSH